MAADRGSRYGTDWHRGTDIIVDWALTFVSPVGMRTRSLLLNCSKVCRPRTVPTRVPRICRHDAKPLRNSRFGDVPAFVTNWIGYEHWSGCVKRCEIYPAACITLFADMHWKSRAGAALATTFSS